MVTRQDGHVIFCLERPLAAEDVIPSRCIWKTADNADTADDGGSRLFINVSVSLSWTKWTAVVSDYIVLVNSSKY